MNQLIRLGVAAKGFIRPFHYHGDVSLVGLEK